MRIFSIAALFFAFSLHAFADTGQVLKVVGGGASSLQQHMEKGKWTVVMIWANDCHVCNQEAGKYSAFHTAHAKKDAKIIGISLDGSEEIAKSFVDRHNLNYPNLVGDVEQVASLYQSETGEAFRATPTFMLYDPNGELKAAQPGGVPPEVIEKFINKSPG